ncbi:hypothetical protein [Rodentibacter heidelbergensis]|uniref:Uncharacterized protein n=1 Tax=Rodentibacter heidelbergensis TaxID=1908258 RepID=A0A1V3I945_9PAST|nr:hypothetical protein [Rodentibacter heidelbergensis]OOF36609.1 hypothetical protein BKK48_04985 [Rodentibacter heidelbergensis]
MSKFLIAILFGLSIFSLSAKDIDTFITDNYPNVSEMDKSCRFMRTERSDFAPSLCIEDVISKDFRSKNDNLYIIVLGGENSSGCHLCPGLIDLYAYTKEGKYIVEKGIEIGSWGSPPKLWSFSKLKNGQVLISVEDLFFQGGEFSCSKYTFTVSNSKFIRKTTEVCSPTSP